MQNLRGGTKDIGRHSVDAKLVLNSRLKRARVEGSPVTPSPKRANTSLNIYSKEERKKRMSDDTLTVDPKQVGVRGSPAKLTPRRANTSLNISSTEKRKENMIDDALAEDPKRARVEESPVTPGPKRANTSLKTSSTEKKKVFHRPKVLIKTEPGIISDDALVEEGISSDDALVEDPKRATIEGSPVTPKTKRANTSLNISSKENQKEKSPDGALAEDPKRARVERSPVTPSPKRANISRNMSTEKRKEKTSDDALATTTKRARAEGSPVTPSQEGANVSLNIGSSEKKKEKLPDDALAVEPKRTRVEGSAVTPAPKRTNTSLNMSSTKKKKVFPRPKVLIKTEADKSPDDALPEDPKRARVEESPVTPLQKGANASLNIVSTGKRKAFPRPIVTIKTEPEKSSDDALPEDPKRARIEESPVTPLPKGANASLIVASTENRKTLPRPKVAIKTEPEEMSDVDLAEDLFAKNPVPIAVCIPRSTFPTEEQPQLQCSTPLRCEPQCRTPMISESSINIKETTITPSNSLERNTTLCKYILSELRSLSDRDATALRQSLNKTMYDFMENVSTP